MLLQYLLFLAKTTTFIIALLILFAGFIAIASKGKDKSKTKFEIKNLNERLTTTANTLRAEILEKTALKKFLKQQKKQEKAQKKIISDAPAKRTFVLNFNGDIRASAVKMLREEITSLLMIAAPTDEVVLKLESPGGMVHAYGLAAAQLQRIRQHNIPLTIVIDKMAASGGYLMAVVGTKILAAPFAIIGSIGVIAQIPNFHRLLKKNDIDVEQIMAGQYKRTLTVFGENTPQGRQKFQEEVNDTQTLFKTFVQENRPQVDIASVATGEHWYGVRALALNLIDGIMTSDDYLVAATKESTVYEICCITKKKFSDKLGLAAHKAYESVLKLFSAKTQPGA